MAMDRNIIPNIRNRFWKLIKRQLGGLLYQRIRHEFWTRPGFNIKHQIGNQVTMALEEQW